MRNRNLWPRSVGVFAGLAAVLGGTQLGAAAALDPASGFSSAPEAAQTVVADELAPPTDDPAAVAEYLKLLEEYRATSTSARGVADLAVGPCLSRAIPNTVPEGKRVSVYRTSGASYTVCVNAAQAVYENEYKALVSAFYEGQKWRDQLVCHIANAWDKKPWNLDAWRPNVGYAATVAAGCNPN